MDVAGSQNLLDQSSIQHLMFIPCGLHMQHHSLVIYIYLYINVAHFIMFKKEIKKKC